MFQTTFNLFCVEKGAAKLAFSHSGNVTHYNSLQPELTLEILRALKETKNKPALYSSLADFGKSEINTELKRLIDHGMVIHFQSEREQSAWSKNSMLAGFVRNQESFKRLTRVLAESRIGIVDFSGAGENFKTSLLQSGFQHVSYLPTATGDLDDKLLNWHNFIAVIGSPEYQLYFSKINQQLFPLKKRWLLITLDDFGGILGPAFGVSGGPCYDCLIDHSKRHFGRGFQSSDYVDLIEENELSDAGAPLAKNIFSLAAVESIKILSQLARPTTFDGFHTLDFFNFRSRYNTVHPSPNCPICSSGST